MDRRLFDLGFAKATESSSLSGDRLGWAFNADEFWVFYMGVAHRALVDPLAERLLLQLQIVLGLVDEKDPDG